MGKRKQSAPRRANSLVAGTSKQSPRKKQRIQSEEEVLWSQEFDDATDAEIAEIKLVDLQSFGNTHEQQPGIRLTFSSTRSKGVDQHRVEDLRVEMRDSSSLVSGRIDGDESLCSSLVYLVRKKFLGIQPGCIPDGTVRVFFTQNLFQACGPNNPGNHLKKHLRSLVTFLRPEVSADVFYGSKEDAENVKRECFDPSGLYNAVKRTRYEPCLDEKLEGLAADLRAYQSQAVHWMVQRERGECENKTRRNPLWISVSCLDSAKTIYYNFVSGRIAYEVSDCCAHVDGGILADEMGLGKTVEVLACIMANKYQGPVHLESAENVEAELKRRKNDRIECVCGDDNTDGIMIQCDCCDAWQHADCIGYSPSQRGKRSKTTRKWQDEISYVWDDNKTFTCGSCAEFISKVEVLGDTGATLIVCPTPILKQWQEEITRHTRTGALKVFVYEGVSKGCFELGEGVKSLKEVGAHHLAVADIVLTTYDVLRSDLHHDIDDDKFYSLRFQKRYQIVATPLTKLRWWRVCLDEAQMVECDTACFTDMALRLNARHKWCVSGTPIQRGLDDLHALLKFLGAKPFDDSSCWTHAIRKPYEEGKPGAMDLTHTFLRDIMWRSSKSQVMDQLRIPDQDEKVTWLKFSRVEAHFYRRQHEHCASKALEVIGKFSSGNRPLNHLESSKLMKPLLRLRQACCHPQVGSSGIRTLQGTPMSMDEVLEVLIEKTTTEGEEAQRTLFYCLNGLAGLAIAEDNLPFAISLYREALATSEENNAAFRVDKLQKMHTLHNLAEMLSLAKDVPRTLRDDILTDQYNEIRMKYLDPFRAQLGAVQEMFYDRNGKISQALSEDKRKGWSKWWLDAFAVIEKKGQGVELVDRIRNALIGDSAWTQNASSLALRFRDMNGLKFLIKQELDAINEGRDAMLQRLLELDSGMDDPPLEYVRLAGHCSQCQVVKDGPICVHCDMENLFQAYEIRLFFLKSTAKEKDGIVTIEEALEAQRQRALATKYRPQDRMLSERVKTASRASVSNLASESEQVLTMLLSHGKHMLSEEVSGAAKKHLEYLEHLRDEYKLANKLALAQRELYQALDDANLSITRNTLDDNEEHNGTGLTFSRIEIPQKNAELTAKKFVAVADLSRAKGQHRYLKSLRRARANKSNEGHDISGPVSEEEECPVCHMNMETEVMVLPCGHVFCCSCMKLVVHRKRSQLKRFPCPTCRQGTYVGDVALAKTDAMNATPEAEVAAILNNSDIPQDDENSSISVAGSYGTKIETVVRRILSLKEADPYVKILIFSSWDDVLDVLEHALRENKLSFSRIKSRRKMDNAISKFKHTNVQVLLLPIKHGANGLNLVEAQHVMLMEPLLNPAAEAQAINRVHRIGQQFKTRVHRFIMRDTVEESIYKLGQKRNTNSALPMKQKEQPLTISDMSDLFSLDQGKEDEEAGTVADSSDTLRRLPPREAAAKAAELRFLRQKEATVSDTQRQ